MIKKFFRYTLLMVAAGMVALSSFAAPANLPKVEILGKNYYVYQAKKGDSLFGISREYDWDYTVLQNLNPNITSPIEKGLKIYYPVEDASKVAGDIANNEQETTAFQHKVKRGDTLFALSRTYNVPVEKLIELNPGSENGIKEGATLIIRQANASSNNVKAENPEFYTIKKGDTLFAVAKKYNTSVAAIMKLNPGVSERNFKAGDAIRLPLSGAGIKKVETTVEQEHLTGFDTYKVNKNDTWETISQKTGVDAKEIKEFNKEIGDKPKNKSLISIPKIDTVKIDTIIAENDPRELTEEGIQEIYEDVHGINDSIALQGVRIVLLLSEPTSKKDLEFTRGIFSGLDYLKDKKQEVNMTVIDGNRASTDVLNDLSDLRPDLVFLTSEKGIPEYLSEYAEISQTPMVNTFDVKNDLYANNPYIIQLLTPSAYFNDEVAEYMDKLYSDYTMIFVGPQDSSDQLAQVIKEKWTPSKVKNLSLEGLKQATFKQDGKFLFYVYPTKKEEVREITAVIEGILQKYPLANIVTLGRPNWIVYDESLAEKFHGANVMIPSRFYFDGNSTSAQGFNRHYKSLFEREPAKAYPMYAAVGYDCARYFIPQLARTNGDLNSFVASFDGAQNDYELYRPGNWTGLVNPVVYLVRFTPYGTIEKNIVK